MSDLETHDEHGEKKATIRGIFVAVFLTLGFLTVLELYVPAVYSAEWNATTKMLLLCILAIAKAMLVAIYFMHLKWETPWIKWIALMPAYMGVAVIIIMLESVYR